ncbi:MAG: hypothetical protein HFG99_02450 [Dorea sp.]|jgi:putative isomerase|nr:hypothetical protein [Dorea sp.]
MKTEGLNISTVPFSARGSYMAVNYLLEDYYSGYVSCTGFSSNLDKMPFVSTPGLYLRSVCTKGQNNNMEMIRFTPLYGGEEIPYDIWADYGLVRLTCEKGEIAFCFADEDTLLIKGTGEGLGLRLDCVIEGRSSFLVKIPLKSGRFYHKLTNHITFDNYGIYTAKGEVCVEQEWESDHLLNTRCFYDIRESGGQFQCAVKELRTYIWVNPEEDGGREFGPAEQANRRAFEDFYAGMPKVPERYEEAHKLAAYLCWSGSVKARGYLKRESVFMTKNILCFVWAYESWLVAAGLYGTDMDLAYDQLMTMMDSQDELGGIPNFKGDGLESYEASMPPNLGWIVGKIMEKAEFSKEQLDEIYSKMRDYTYFYLNHMDETGDGVFEYHHGYDACGDDDTVFRDELNISCPDLTTLLILQMDCLEKVAKKLGKRVEAAQWKQLSERSTEGLVKTLFDENGMPFAKNNVTGERIYAESPILFTPLMLGDRLPEKIRNVMIGELKAKKYITPFGLASEEPDSRYYDAEGFFRGPVWFTMTLTTIEGLIQCHEEEMAQDLVIKYCDLVKNGGCAECYNAQTGEPLNNKGYVSTAGTFLFLAHDYLK